MKETSGTEIALFGDKSKMPAYLDASDNLGNENIGSEDVVLPRLDILQQMSAATARVPNAKAGMLYNTVTDELYDELYVLNLAYDKEYTVFKDRSLGGGYHGAYSSRSEAEQLIDSLPGSRNDYSINETGRHTLLILKITEEGAVPYQPAVMLLSNTKFYVSKEWNTQIKTIGGNANRFATVWKLSTVKQSNIQGEWYNLHVEFAGWAPPELHEQAKVFYQNSIV